MISNIHARYRRVIFLQNPTNGISYLRARLFSKQFRLNSRYERNVSERRMRSEIFDEISTFLRRTRFEEIPLEYFLPRWWLPFANTFDIFIQIKYLRLSRTGTYLANAAQRLRLSRPGRSENIPYNFRVNLSDLIKMLAFFFSRIPLVDIMAALARDKNDELFASRCCRQATCH